MKAGTRDGLGIALAALLVAPAAVTAAPDALVFQALLDGKPIGTHEFRIRDEQSRRVVETTARFDVSILFVNVFSYRHSNTEVWQDGCLQRLDSETDSNGTVYQVDVTSRDDGYRVATQDETSFYPMDCLMSFAYWDRRFLERDRLINAQTGEVMDVEIEPLGTAELEWIGATARVEGFRIVSEPQDVDIKVYYGEADGRWVALESILESGRIMRYVPAGDDVASSGRSGGDTFVTGR